MSKLLEVSNLSMRFGGLLAVNGVALQLREKEIVSIIGPNGAGKTTVFRVLMKEEGFDGKKKTRLRLSQLIAQKFTMQ